MREVLRIADALNYSGRAVAGNISLYARWISGRPTRSEQVWTGDLALGGLVGLVD